MDLLALIVAPSLVFAFGLALCIAARREAEERRERQYRELFLEKDPDPRSWPEWADLEREDA